jgi:hypothetical protein
MYDRLMDMLAQAPEVLKKSDVIPQLPPHLLLPALIDLAESVRAADGSLQAYYAELVVSSTTPLFWEEPARLTTLDESPAAAPEAPQEEDVNLRFKDLEAARTLTMYWAMLALSWSGIHDLYMTFAQLLASNIIPDALRPVVQGLLTEPPDWRDPVRKVCRSVHYCISDRNSGIGIMHIAVPLDIVTNVMRNRTGCEKEYLEALRVGKEIQSEWIRVNQFDLCSDT